MLMRKWFTFVLSGTEYSAWLPESEKYYPVLKRQYWEIQDTILHSLCWKGCAGVLENFGLPEKKIISVLRLLRSKVHHLDHTCFSKTYEIFATYYHGPQHGVVNIICQCRVLYNARLSLSLSFPSVL